MAMQLLTKTWVNGALAGMITRENKGRMGMNIGNTREVLKHTMEALARYDEQQVIELIRKYKKKGS